MMLEILQLRFAAFSMTAIFWMRRGAPFSNRTPQAGADRRICSGFASPARAHHGIRKH